MRRIALLGLLALLPGCDKFASSPFVGFGGFIGDTHTLTWNPTRPVAVSENQKRIEDQPVNVEPLLPEPGEVWPGPPPPIPTMQDVQSLTTMEFLPPASIPGQVAPPVFPQNAPVNSPASVPPPGTVHKTP